MSIFVPKDRRSLFRQFLGGMYDAVVITDPNGHILDLNPRATEHFGYEFDEALDQPVSLLVPSLQTAVVQRIRHGLDDERHVLVSANGRTRDGVKFACEVAVSMIDLMNPGDLVFTIRNIERRRVAMNALRARSAAFALTRDSLFVCDAEGRFRDANPAFFERVGWKSEEELRRHALTDLWPDRKLAAALKSALDGERTTACVDGVTFVLAPDAVGRKIRGVVGLVSGS